MEIDGAGGVINAVVAVFRDVVADLPELDVERFGMLDAEEVVTVVRGKRRFAADFGPEAGGLPIEACGVFTEDEAVGGLGVGIRDPRGRLGGFTASVSGGIGAVIDMHDRRDTRSEEHTSELQSPCNLVCRLLLEKKKTI